MIMALALAASLLDHSSISANKTLQYDCYAAKDELSYELWGLFESYSDVKLKNERLSELKVTGYLVELKKGTEVRIEGSVKPDGVRILILTGSLRGSRMYVRKGDMRKR